MADQIGEENEVAVFEDIHGISDYVISKWTEIAENAIRDNNNFTVALSGGNTPLNLYRRLADYKILPWNKTHVFMVDERYVPYTHGENNFRMINETLLVHVNIPAKNIHPIITSDTTARDSAAKYEEELASYFQLSYGKLPVFNLILLGIGGDGHTASLFPDTESVKETTHMAIALTPSDKTKRERITLTFPIINNAAYICFLVAGSNKAEAVKRIIEDRDSRLPASMVRPNNGRLVFLLDKEAASLLSK